MTKLVTAVALALALVGPIELRAKTVDMAPVVSFVGQVAGLSKCAAFFKIMQEDASKDEMYLINSHLLHDLALRIIGEEIRKSEQDVNKWMPLLQQTVADAYIEFNLDLASNRETLASRYHGSCLKLLNIYLDD